MTNLLAALLASQPASIFVAALSPDSIRALRRTCKAIKDSANQQITTLD